MKNLSRDEMKKIMAGVEPPPKCPLECSSPSCSSENYCKCTNGGTQYSFCESAGNA